MLSTVGRDGAVGTAVAELELAAAMAGDYTATATLQRQQNGSSGLIGFRERVHRDAEVAADVPVVLAKCEAVGMAGVTAQVQPWCPRAQEKRKRTRERERESSVSF